MNNLNDLDIPELVLTPSTTNFYEHKKCFKLCVKDMKINYLSSDEESCSKNCLQKHLEAMAFV